MPHQGENLQETIKQSGFSISRLVQALGITRPTMYRKFREETLDDTFVKRIQDIIGRSITSDAPTNSYSHDTTVGTPVSNGGSMIPTTVDEYAKALISLQQKHIKLLEDYNILLTKLYTGR